MNGELAVLLAGKLAGFVRSGKERSCWFSYNANYTGGRDRVPLSLTVPVAAGRYDIFDWMDGLLPTSTEVRREWAQRYGAASINPMDMLSTPVGWDCAGAVQFCVPQRLGEMTSRAAWRVEMSEAELAQHLEFVRRGMSGAGPAHLSATGCWPCLMPTPRTTACCSMGRTSRSPRSMTSARWPPTRPAASRSARRGSP